MKQEYLWFLFFPFMIKACPDEESILPCKCHPSYLTEITCDKLTNEQDLVKVTKSMSGSGIEKIHVFGIFNSTFRYIPSDLFEKIKVSTLVIQNSTFLSLTDTDVAFSGLEDSLDVLLIENCNVIQEWDLSVFQNLRSLKILSVIGAGEENVNYLDALTELKAISLVQNRIKVVYEKAFEKFKHLAVLRLDDNLISNMKRSMLPNPANYFWMFTLKNNMIEHFPNDMFTNMPLLKRLDISYNELLTLDEKTFSPVWSNLLQFEATGNELFCECRLKWITKTSPPKQVEADCYQPELLRGTNILNLHELLTDINC